MKTFIRSFLVLTALVCGVLNAAPVVSDVNMSQDPGTCLVTVTYKLSGDPGVITLDIQTNCTDGAETKWVSIGPENMKGFGGDVHQVVQPTAEDEVRTIHWSPETYWPGPPKMAGATRAVVTAWATNAPPDYMIVHLIEPYDVTYYPHVEMVPGGITNIKYKGEYMPFRKIPAKGVIWWAGMPTNHKNYHEASKLHRVMLTEDYYMGVYEVTVAQYGAINNGVPNDSRIPRSWISSKDYRGSTKGLQWPAYNEDGTFNYEKSREVDETSICGKLRDKFNMEFDLPTEHQWEYACRAGSPGTVYTDTVPTLNFTDNATALRICRFNKNKGSADCEGLGGDYATVGSYEPNAWGLYDMLGNVHEACVDWFENWSTVYPDDNKIYVDPVGPERGEKIQRIYRGYAAVSSLGETVNGVSICGRVSRARDWNNVWQNEGVRLCVTLH